MCRSGVLPPTPQPIDWAVLDRYFRGTATPAEVEAIRQWLGDSDHRALADAVFRLGIPQPLAEQDWKTSAALGRLMTAIRKRERRPPIAAVGRRPSPRATPMAIAASLLVALGLGVVIGRTPRRQAATDYHEYRTGVGQLLTVTLTDGSRFTLAPASRARVPLAYGDATRSITLEGEAYFTVVHDARRPFTVQAGKARTIDLGTAFDVRAYAGDSDVRVVVAEGRVSVGGGTDASATIQAGQSLSVDQSGHFDAPQLADAGALTGWREGRLAHHDVLASVVVADLGRWFGLNIELTPQLGDQRLTVDWTNVAPDQVVTELATLLNARVERRGDRVLLTGRTQDTDGGRA